MDLDGGQSRHGSLNGHRQPLRASSANVGLGAWLSTVIYMVIYVDNSDLGALQKTRDPPWLALPVAGAEGLRVDWPKSGSMSA